MIICFDEGRGELHPAAGVRREDVVGEDLAAVRQQPVDDAAGEDDGVRPGLGPELREGIVTEYRDGFFPQITARRGGDVDLDDARVAVAAAAVFFCRRT